MADDSASRWTWFISKFIFAVLIIFATASVNAVLNNYPSRPIADILGERNNEEVIVSLPPITDESVIEAYSRATLEISSRSYPETTKEGCPFKVRSTIPNKRSVRALDIQALAVEGKIQERAACFIKAKYGMKRHHMKALRNYGVGRSNKKCLKKMQLLDHRGDKCSKNHKYRSLDGVCNNLRYPLRGASITAYSRGLTAEYADGISAPRVSSKDGSPLPLVRSLSNEIMTRMHTPSSKNFSVFMTSWGQFLSHDMGSGDTAKNASDCCSKKVDTPDCIQIRIAENDKYYSKYHARCFGMTRSQPAPQPDCSLGPRDQINLSTSFLDASIVYGTSIEELAPLRRYKNGQLKTSFVDGTMLLPVQTNTTTSTSCSQTENKPFCFMAGDFRHQQNLGLLSLHTLWLEEHNRLSDLLSTLNPSWDDDKVFEETRRIVIAELQHVTYSEYLPQVIGKLILDEYGLRLRDSGYFKEYSDVIDPSLSNEFSHAAMRFGHSAIQDEWQFAKDEKIWQMPLNDGMFRPDVFARDNATYASFMLGTTMQSASTVGPYYSPQITNHLFQFMSSGYGIDLASIDLIRGRDNGLPPYNAFRQYCGLSRILSFEELKSVFIDAVAGKFAKVYKSVDDIDLLLGGLSERPMSSSQLGPVFTCLFAEQFARLRYGDRYWYENGPRTSPYPFTPEQLTQIRRVTAARLVCDNLPNMDALPPHLFLLPSKKNPPINCHSKLIPALDIQAWKE